MPFYVPEKVFSSKHLISGVCDKSKEITIAAVAGALCKGSPGFIY